MRTPAPRARFAKTRSPTCSTGLAGAWRIGVGRGGTHGRPSVEDRGARAGRGAGAPPGPPADGRAQAPAVMPLTAGRDLRAELVAQRRRAGRLRRGLLALRAGDVGEEALHQIRLAPRRRTSSRRSGRRPARSGRCPPRWCRGRGRRRSCSRRGPRPASTRRGRSPRPRGSGRRTASPTLTSDLAELTGLALVGVADGAVAALDRADDTGGALRGLAALDRPGAAGLVRSRRRRAALFR